MTLRQHYARPRARAITRHPGQAGRAGPSHTGRPGAGHRVSLPTACAAGSASSRLLPQVAGSGRFLWVSCG